MKKHFTLFTVVLLVFFFGIQSSTYAQSPWTEKAGMLNKRQGHSSGVLDGKIYVVGGVQYNAASTHYNAIKSIEFYDTSLDVWKEKAGMNTGRVQFPTCVYDGKIWAIGGGQSVYWDPLTSIETYDPVFDTWTYVADLPKARMGHTASLVDGKIYIIGGAYSNEMIPISEIVVYDPITDTWDSTKTSIPTTRMNLTAVVLNGKIYVIGGHSGVPGGELGLKKVEVYDPATDTWEEKADMIWPRKYFSSSVLDNNIYVFGGASGNCTSALSTMEAYDPLTDTWTQGTDISNKWVMTASASLNGNIYVSGGTFQICPPSVRKTFREYNPSNDTLVTEINPGIVEGNFEFEGRIRNYEVYFPQNFQSNMPVIISLHGYTETVEWYKNYTLLHEHGDSSGFVTVYPKSASISWNTGETFPPYGWPPYDTTVNDVGFISVLIDTLYEKYEIDLSRVYCCGFSSGGEMAFRLAVELGHRIAAVGSVNGPLNDVSASGEPIRPIPIIYIHGTKDKYLDYYEPYDNIWSVEETINFWVENNDCSQFYNNVSLPDLVTTDGCTVDKISYTDCSDESNIVHYKINEGGHNWPSFVNYNSDSWEGNKTRDIDANTEIWNFFKNFEKSQDTIVTETWSQKADMPTARYFLSSCTLDDKIYVMGGTTGHSSSGPSVSILEVYDPNLDSWDITKADMLTSKVEFGALKVNGKIYVIGGVSNHGGAPLGTIEEYDPSTNTWSSKTTMPTPRYGIASAVIDNKIYVAGGTVDDNWTVTNKLEIYDPSTDDWDVTKASMPQAIYQPQGASVDDMFYVIGGLLGTSPWTGQKIVQMYDPSTDSWSIMENLNDGRVGHTATAINGKIHVIGGDTQPPPLKSVEEYDPNSNTWTKIDDAPFFKNCLTASLFENKIYVFGGSTTTIFPNANPTSAVYSYRPLITFVGIDENISPNYYVLSQNYPNPFNPSTTIKYEIPGQARNDILHVTLKVYDILGREVATLVNEQQKAGYYEVDWNAVNNSSGIYFYRIQAGDFIKTKKMLLLR